MNSDTQETHDAPALVSEWLTGFEAALEHGEHGRAARAFLPDGHWRDLLAFTWDVRTFSGPADIERALKETTEEIRPHGFRLDHSTPPRELELLGVPTVEALFTFRTVHGRARGAVRLARDTDGRLGAWTLLTTLQELAGFEEHRSAQRAQGASALRNFGEKNWLDLRQEAVAYDDREPAVLIVGGGHNGLVVAARLNQLNVDTLVVDPMERIGDNWRKRYRALVLHNETEANHLPYLPFPDTWPTYIAKDKLANWFEAYAESLEVNFWTSTRAVSGEYDAVEQRWTVLLRRSDGSERVVRPRHVVMATGASGIPHVPVVDGLDRFQGEVLHSSRYKSGESLHGRRVVVFGTGNSAHDIVQDLHGHGVDVTMVQRGSTTVVSVDPSSKLNSELYMQGLPVEDADMVASSIPYALAVRTSQQMSIRSMELDAELLAGLADAGFRTDFGEDGTGWTMKFRRRAGGYYLNVGCSDLIAAREVGLVQADELESVTSSGFRLRDGSELRADVIVFATGYKNQQELVRQMFGSDVADRVGPVWGLDDEGELRNLWRRTGQESLWFMAGSLVQARPYSRILALQIKAVEEGVAPRGQARRSASC